MTFWPLISYNDSPIDQTFHQFYDIVTDIDLHRITSSCHGAFARGMTCQQGTHGEQFTLFKLATLGIFPDATVPGTYFEKSKQNKEKREEICNEREKICNVANLPPWGKVCNVAGLPGEGLQCCRSSGGNVCNVADLPGGGRYARGKVCNTTPAKMEYYYSGTESLWCGKWNHFVCHKWKCEVYHPSRSTVVI